LKALIVNALALLVLVSAACAYHSPAAPSPPAPDLTTPAHLYLDASPSQQVGGTATITARVLNSVNTGLGNVPVTFTADVGTVEGSALTDATGTARVVLVGRVGPDRVTAQAWPLTTVVLVALQPGR
jgi:hypothetical protein